MAMPTAKQLANLKPLNTRPKEIQREIQRQGVIASAKRKAEMKRLREKLTEALSDGAVYDKLIDKLITLALSGNLEAMKIIFERLEGKAPQSISISETSNADTPSGLGALYKEFGVLPPDESTKE